MANKKYTLIASIRNEEIIDYLLEPDALNTIAYSKDWIITANDERKAISEFQNSDIYYRFCEEHNYVYTYIKSDSDAFFRRADIIPSVSE